MSGVVIRLLKNFGLCAILSLVGANGFASVDDCIQRNLQGLLSPFQSTARAGSRTADQSLTELEEYLARNQWTTFQVTRSAEGATLRIGFLSSDNQRALALLHRAVRSGAITRIEAGDVVGPQVLDLLLSLRRIAPADRPLLVRGQINAADLANKAEEAFARGQLSRAQYSRWEQARREMDIDGGCRTVFGPLASMRNCGVIHFVLDARNPSVVRYSPQPLDISSGQLPAAVVPRSRPGAFEALMGPPRLD